MATSQRSALQHDYIEAEMIFPALQTPNQLGIITIVRASKKKKKQKTVSFSILLDVLGRHCQCFIRHVY